MALNVRDAVRKYGIEYLAVCGMAHYFPVMSALSHVFFVDGSQGNDSAANKGQTPDTPLKSITKALSYCSSWSGITRSNEFIFVLGYYQASTETWPIAVTKDHVHIIGIYNGYTGGPSWIQPPADTAAITIAADGVELANLELGAGANHGGLEIIGNATWGLHVHHCRFGMENGMTTKYGILIGKAASGSEMINGLIEDCSFGDKCATACIMIPSTAGWCGSNSVPGTVIRNSIFRVADAAKGIYVTLTTANFQDGGILNNKFIVDGTVDGSAVSFAAGTKGMVDGNQAVYKDESTICAVATGNLFHTGADGMSWGRNWVSGTLLAIETDYTT